MCWWDTPEYRKWYFGCNAQHRVWFTWEEKGCPRRHLPTLWRQNPCPQVCLLLFTSPCPKEQTKLYCPPACPLLGFRAPRASHPVDFFYSLVLWTFFNKHFFLLPTACSWFPCHRRNILRELSTSSILLQSTLEINIGEIMLSDFGWLVVWVLSWQHQRSY